MLIYMSGKQLANWVIIISKETCVFIRFTLGQAYRTYGTRAQSGKREDFLGTRHSLLSQL
jgi:hypothetical protein